MDQTLDLNDLLILENELKVMLSISHHQTRNYIIRKSVKSDMILQNLSIFTKVQK